MYIELALGAMMLLDIPCTHASPAKPLHLAGGKALLGPLAGMLDGAPNWPITSSLLTHVLPA